MAGLVGPYFLSCGKTIHDMSTALVRGLLLPLAAKLLWNCFM